VTESGRPIQKLFCGEQGILNSIPPFKAMWLQYDHLLTHARSGNNDLENIVITCAPCNYGRWNRTVEEVGLIDPRTREPVRSAWDGLERFRGTDKARSHQLPYFGAFMQKRRATSS
jgi:hypothetical protein